jgi:endonuclease/exonuclease/phosphatase (EEP) superfamily protein YafD
LQEVEPVTFVALRSYLGERGYVGDYARKIAGRPEGLAIFHRSTIFKLISSNKIAYADGGGVSHDTGYIAQWALLQCGDKKVGVINTHLTWDPPSTARELQRGLRQAQQCLAEYRARAAAANGWIVSGDFNVTPDSEIVALAVQAGLQFAHRDFPRLFTCNIGGSARLIDYLFYSGQLRAEASLLRRIDNLTILPSLAEPSDHVPVMAHFRWRP